MNKKERVGLIVETDYGVLMVKDRKDHYLQRDLKSIPSFYSLAPEFQKTVFYQRCQRAIKELDDFLAAEGDPQFARLLLDRVEISYRELKYYRRLFEQAFTNPGLRPTRAEKGNPLKSDPFNHDVAEFFQNYGNDQEKVLRFREFIDQQVKRFWSLLVRSDNSRRKIREISNEVGIEKKKGLVNELILDGRFSLAGGRVEKNECYLDTAIRELMEETHLQIERVQFYGKIPGALRTHCLFIAKACGQLRILPEEISGIGFLTRNTPLPLEERQLQRLQIPYLRAITQGHIRRLYAEYILDHKRRQFRTEKWLSKVQIPRDLVDKWRHDHHLANQLDNLTSYHPPKLEPTEKFEIIQSTKPLPEFPATLTPEIIIPKKDEKMHPKFRQRIYGKYSL